MAKSPSGTRPETEAERQSREYWEEQNREQEAQNTWAPIIAIGFGLVALLIAALAFGR